ncbi:MAG TPA: TraM recognition domain-containing protein [Bacteriovoracaceae bacterium]|nr:TraM recognition domain-containing protein [Bacteriovoracaceae bacterium]
MSSNPESHDDKSGPNPIAIGGILVAMGVAGWWTQNERKITGWYVNHYEEIYLAGWAVVLLIIGLVILKVMKKTQRIKERGELLGPLWDQKSQNILIGSTADKVDLHLSDELRCTHVQIIGTTGRGKTQSVVIPWTLRDLQRGMSVIIIDGKGSRDVPVILQSYIDRYNVGAWVHEFDLDKPDTSVKINPLKLGTPQQIVDRIFSSFEFQDPFYRAVQYDICGYLVRLIFEIKEVVTFRHLYELLTDEKILADKLKLLSDGDKLKRHLLDYLKTPANDRKQKLAGLTSQLSPFAVGELSAFVNGGDGEVILADVMDSNKPTQLLMMSIPTLKYQKIGHQLGKLILQDLAFCVGDREKNRFNDFCAVFLDEFSEFAYEGFVSVLNKARSAKIGLHLSHQSMSDLSKVSPDFAKSVMTNTNIKCILGLNDPETADYFAKHMGTFTEEKLTEQVEEEGFFKHQKATGRGSMREVESYKVHPNDLKRFTRGRGVLHVPTGRGNVTEVIQFQTIGGRD